jgi:hypothetical protein
MVPGALREDEAPRKEDAARNELLLNKKDDMTQSINMRQ